MSSTTIHRLGPRWLVFEHGHLTRTMPVITGGDGSQDPPAGDPPAGDPPASDPPAGDPPAGDPPAGDPPAGDPPLGDAGKRALEAERKARREAEAELARLRKAQMTDQEKLIEDARADERRKGAANLLAAKVIAAATGKLQDPTDALALVASKIQIADDGTFDETAIVSHIDELVTNKPYLAAKTPGATPAPGSANGGPQGGGPAQWTLADLDGKTPEQIEAARIAGHLNAIQGIT